MGCGCRNRGTQTMETKTTEPPVAVVATTQDHAGTKSFDDSLACGRCYAKHLSKALVQFREWREDETRDAELSLCLGNIGCAEDHAAALRREADRKRLRDLRERIWEKPELVEPELQRLAAEATRAVVVAERVERAHHSAGKKIL